MPTSVVRRNIRIRILLLNPNSSQDMTDGMVKAVRSLNLPDALELHTYTAPSASPASINGQEDLDSSAEVVLDDFTADQASSYDAILVACYSVHPLVERLSSRDSAPLVTGIFEASILTSLSLLPAYSSSSSSGPSEKADRQWGIVTTGKFWEKHLTAGVGRYLGQEASDSPRNAKFAGVFSTGLNAGDFHDGVPPEVIREKLKAATKKLLDSGTIGCVVMGCAGMAGLEEIIRSTAIEVYGERQGDNVCIIDGVKAGLGLLQETVKSKRMFQGN